MAYKFSSGLTIRVILISLLSLLMVLCLFQAILNNFAAISWWILTGIFFIFLSGAAINLYHFTNSSNRKLTLFFDSIRFDDFSIRFSSDDAMGKTFHDLNKKFVQVQEAFKVARAENEASLHLMKTLIANIQTGLLVFDSFGRIEMINNAACDLLGYYRLKNISELSASHPGLAEKIKTDKTAGNQFLYRTSKNHELAVNVLPLLIREKEKKLVVFHNISEELQRKEVEAWQNLARVLRHEIMNSLTPVLSLVGTMKHIVRYELPGTQQKGQPWHDLLEALETIEKRGRGMISFVENYRHFANIPLPRLSVLNFKTYIPHVKKLLQPETEAAGILFDCQQSDQDLYFQADAEQLSMVIINLVKNAREALTKTTSPAIALKVYPVEEYAVIEIIDNGDGIEPAAINEIFIPFFSTKKSGAGIGLSLSRQMIQQMGGQIKVKSEPGKGSHFFIFLLLAGKDAISSAEF